MLWRALGIYVEKDQALYLYCGWRNRWDFLLQLSKHNGLVPMTNNNYYYAIAIKVANDA